MRLLVSVTDAAEARVAVEAGVDIVDVKNPAEGSLGAAGPRVIESVREVVPPERPVSAAVGDLPALPGTAALAALGAARSGAAYVKVGLWGTPTTDGAVAVLRAVRDALDGGVTVIAAAYADAERVPGGPLPPAALGAACSTPPSRTAAGCSTGSPRRSSRRWWPRATPRDSRWRSPERCAPMT
jgi:(5-formylfuran-3-yl)methyl phosphate synthase